jgi:hypothetical protein
MCFSSKCYRYAARFDCGSEFDFEVKLFAENKKDLLDSFQFNCNLNAGRSWFQVSFLVIHIE